MEPLTIREEAELTSRISKCPAIICMFEIYDSVFDDTVEHFFLVVLN